MLHRTGRSKAMGTALQGYITITFDELVDKFGLPETSSDKVKASWTLVDSGCVVTIYDYKSLLDPEDNVYWHIGGMGPLAVRLVSEAFPTHDVRTRSVT